MKISRAVALGALAIAVLVGLLAVSAWYVMEVPPVSAHQMGQVRVGMDPQQVRQILGEPSDTSGEPSSATWVYSRRCLWQTVHVEFENGKVSAITLDK